MIKTSKLKRYCLFQILLLAALSFKVSADSLSYTPITVHINSGNPVYPFPQFQPYQNPSATLGNLANHPGVGVTHLEMEQTIRDAYQIMMNRALKPGGGVGGKDYIKFRSSPQCSEGDGYGLLGAASMADKETFDGLWLYIHDFTMNKVKRYSDCKETSPGYAYSHLPGWTGSGANSATDGDVDIGLALLTAYLQWGEFMGINDACGEPISYKKEAIEFLKGLTDTLSYAASNNATLVSGDIGLDGYVKGGDSWQELTDWANDISRSGFNKRTESGGPQKQHFDYIAPSYFHAFADFLTKEDPVRYAWNIKQFKRAEASSDWLMGQLLPNEKYIPIAGWVSVSKDKEVTFANDNEGEDFRLGWRTILNALWNGNPGSTWDPVSHQVKSGAPNSYEQDIGKRFARFLWDSRQTPWNNAGMPNVGGDKTIMFWGTEVIKQNYTIEGQPVGSFPLNWIPGTGSPSTVIAQDFNLMAELYRSLEMKWDSDNSELYLKSIPHYFHEWFRLMGMLTLTGNYQSPAEIMPTANTKVYLGINKTFAFEGDSVIYTIDYRNFGSLDAKDVTIVDTLHKDFIYISSTGGGVYNASAKTVTWNIGTVPGVKTATGVTPTVGQFKLVVKVGIASQKQYRNKVSISCSNGSGWTSNEYPNNISSVMERNYLDIAKRALVIKKTVSNPLVNPGKDVQVSIDFENTSEAGWINGGRPGVRFAFSHASIASGSGPSNVMRVRLVHDANEAYIDYGNYRVSYFLFDAGLTCYKDIDGCSAGWQINPTIVEGVDQKFIKVFNENVMAGEDSHGKWNQRIVVQFSDPTDPARTINLTTTTYYITWYRGNVTQIHRGGRSPLRLVWDLHASTYKDVNWSDDWSWDKSAVDVEDGRYWPITNDWTDPDKPDIPVDRWYPKECDTATHTIDNVLVEEWDGYTWRRVAGNGPLPGRDVSNVIIRDTIPAGLAFSKFTGDAPLGVAAKVDGNIITWTIPKLQIKQKGSLKYIMTTAAGVVCPMQNKPIKTRSWISADKESAISDSATITVTCDSVPPPPPSPTTMYKTSDKALYKLGDTVTYKIAYKQTHGTIFNGAMNADDWIDKSGKGKFSFKGDTIVYDKPSAIMVHKYALGKNGTFGGTLSIAYWDSCSLVARVDGSNFVEMRFRSSFADDTVKFFNNETQIGSKQTFTYKTFPAPFNFKVRLAEDTLQFWAGDTSALLPNFSQTGIAIREGYAGVKSTTTNQSKLWGWNSHMDAAFDLSIHDKLPSNLTYKSAIGSIITGKSAGTQLTATFNNGDIKWPVVSGDGFLSAGDSVNLTVKATLDLCTGDTIFNTAYTNLRGWPTDQIGARARSTCSSGNVEPDHIDFVIDSANFSKTSDEIIDPITLGTNKKTVTLYAVIRDKDGNYLGKATDAVWSSSNSAVANVDASPSGKWIGIISSVGAGTTMIKATAPGVPKGDSISVTVSASASWPTIKSAVMSDKNADLTPDMLTIVLTDDFVTDQKLDSVSIDYRGNRYSFPASSIDKQNLTLTIPFTSQTGIDSRPTAKATIYLTSEGQRQQNTKSVVDGVPPALTAASVLENDGSSKDILYLTFSEPIQRTTNTLIGKQLLLIKANTTDTAILTIDDILASPSDTMVTVQVSSVSAGFIRAGDALRLMPGSRGGTIVDQNLNLPHDLNRSVVLTLKKAPASVSSVVYKDTDANGFIDDVILSFKRAVQLSEISSIILHWNIDPAIQNNPVDLSKVQKINDSTFIIPAQGENVSPVKIRTDPSIEISISYVSFPDQIKASFIADSAGPVVLSAELFPGAQINNVRQDDTLSVVMSEQVKQSFGSNPFLFTSKTGSGQYSIQLSYLSYQGTTYRFTVNPTNSGSSVYITSGDSLWINPVARLSDNGGALQINPSNNRVPVTIVWPPTTWRAIAMPNLFKPDSTKIPSDFPRLSGKSELGIGIKAYPVTSTDVSQSQASCTIYDAVGNVVAADPMLQRGDAFYYTWDGYNRNRRTVGVGTYSGIIVIRESSGAKSVCKVKIAVKR